MEKPKHLKRLKKYYVPFFIVCILSIPFLVWELQQPKFIHAVIVDKTVPNQTYREHKGFMWVLNNLKYFNRQTSGAFQYDQDYYGFFPLDDHNYDIKDLPDTVEGVDLIYLVDTYGVFTDDFDRNNINGNRSDLIYGGTDMEDIKFIKHSMNEKTVLVGEFNVLESPTGEKARAELESMFQVKWSGWIGRYFIDLSSKNTEIPSWLRDNYKRQYQKEWDFTGPGFALVKSDDTVIILQQGKEVGNGLNRIVFTPEALKELNVRNNIRYYYWFDIIENTGDSEVLANNVLDLTPAGEQLLQQYGLKGTFPAVVRSKSPYHSFYLAGDYSDTARTPSYWNMAFLAESRKWLSIDTEGDSAGFYWKVYNPLIGDILKEVPS